MRVTTIVAAAGLGATGMYLLDPERGNARRATLRDRTMHAVRRGWRWTRGATTGLRDHIRGLLADWHARRVEDRPSDTVLVERVRSEMGHFIRHPHKVSVTADTGWVRLAGYVLPDEKDALVSAIRNVPGVFGLEDHLEERGWLESQLESMTPPTPANAPPAGG
jgi:osmotically-inducible protein OsmY